MQVKRRGKNFAVLVINAEKLRLCDYKILRAGRSICLVSYVPAEFIVKLAVLTYPSFHNFSKLSSVCKSLVESSWNNIEGVAYCYMSFSN